ncbi:unnamed protein product [Rangifer tarandus platyrhynchus]|uniref:Uncharacterized protein n=2 Tax=Rangifer tarandus platyrhynchus TaxID=3082113 RepID=A0ABN8Y0A6_RANTA|nr:unnamed protein product [Rangifer tarandus platyrhynchus]CAI9692676.1 unnamed protein product [Rangifer tarandus platyrhynchus]
MSLHLWFSAVSFQTPVDLADTLRNPGDPLRQEAQLKPAWIPDPSGCEAGNEWSLKSLSLRLFVPAMDDFLCAPCQKQAELGLNGLPAEALWAGPWRLPARGPWSNCMATGELDPEARPGLPAGTLVSGLLARGPRVLPCGGAAGEEAPGWWLLSGPVGGLGCSGARPPRAQPALISGSPRSWPVPVAPVSWRCTCGTLATCRKPDSQRTATAYRRGLAGVAAALGVSPAALALPGSSARAFPSCRQMALRAQAGLEAGDPRGGPAGRSGRSGLARATALRSADGRSGGGGLGIPPRRPPAHPGSRAPAWALRGGGCCYCPREDGPDPGPSRPAPALLPRPLLSARLHAHPSPEALQCLPFGMPLTKSLLDQTSAGLRNLLLGPCLLFLMKCSSSKNTSSSVSPAPHPLPLIRVLILCSLPGEACLQRESCGGPGVGSELLRREVAVEMEEVETLGSGPQAAEGPQFLSAPPLTPCSATAWPLRAVAHPRVPCSRPPQGVCKGPSSGPPSVPPRDIPS